MKRIGVAGLGLIGARHARALALCPDATLACVVDPDAAARHRYDAPGFASIEEIDVALDGIILATPSALHAAHVEAGLARGWPCLVEKPLAADLAGADRIVAAAAASGLAVLTGHHRRHHECVQRLRQIVQQDIGQPILASAIWAVKKPDSYFTDSWRDGRDGSPVMINMVHDIDLLRFVLGEVVEVVAIGGQPVRGAGRVESGAFSLRFASGAIASVGFADTAPSPWGFEAGTGENPNIAATQQDCLWIVGSAGGVSFPSLTVWSGASDWSEPPEAVQFRVAANDALNAQIVHFLAVIDGATALIDAEDARRSLQVTLQVEAQVAPGGVAT